MAHVLARVIAPHVPDLELPCVVVGVDDVHAVVVGDDTVVDSKDGLSVCLNPRYLHGRQMGLAGSRGGSTLGVGEQRGGKGEEAKEGRGRNRTSGRCRGEGKARKGEVLEEQGRRGGEGGSRRVL